jgi:2-polyprenyl-3-methyl-5-hydroxy-6-metoxy-1,4-benzoquinol methylase
MILHQFCQLCGSKSLSGFAIDTVRVGPHISRVICENCGIVFANPMADSVELELYYQSYYKKEKYQAISFKEKILDEISRIRKLDPVQIKSKVRYVKDLEAGDKFLDVGCGLGLGLAYANQLGCELYATEFDNESLEFVKNNFSVKTHQGDLSSASYPDDFFDFIHISHVIEHLIDPRAYIKEMKRILKPRGILAIGTPDMSSKLYTFHRWVNFLRFRVPDIIDGLEHTFIFPKKRLRSLTEEEGFTVIDHYTHNLGEQLRHLVHYQIPLSKKISRLIQNGFHINQWITCRK